MTTGADAEKPFRAALLAEIARPGGDEDLLRRVARALLERAETGDAAAIREVAERLDGKPAASGASTGGRLARQAISAVAITPEEPEEWRRRYANPLRLGAAEGPAGGAD